MPLPNDYASQSCSVARALEIVGERWTLKTLVAEGVLAREPGSGGHDEYALTEKGQRLWPVLRELMSWGDTFYAPRGPRRMLTHATDGGKLDGDGRCAICGEVVSVPDTISEPGPGFDPAERRDDPITAAIGHPRRLLDPLHVPSSR